jgi:hypothetical protein
MVNWGLLATCAEIEILVPAKNDRTFENHSTSACPGRSNRRFLVS